MVSVEPLNRVNACRVTSESEKDLWCLQERFVSICSGCLEEGVQDEHLIAGSIGYKLALRVVVYRFKNRVRVGCNQHAFDLHTLFCLYHS